MHEYDFQITAELTEAHFLAWIEGKIEQLYQEAKPMVDGYWDRLAEGQKQHAKAERGHIGVRIRRREHCLSFSIEWFRIKKVRKDLQDKVIAVYIRKGRGYRYPLERMLKGEPEWEADIIEALETEFAEIRRQMDLLGKIRDKVQDYFKTVEQG